MRTDESANENVAQRKGEIILTVNMNGIGDEDGRDEVDTEGGEVEI